MKKEAYLDARGNKVEIGDTLAVAFRSSSTAHIRVGKVVSFDTMSDGWKSDGQPLIVVEWEKLQEGGSLRPETSKIYADTYGRFLIIQKEVADV